MVLENVPISHFDVLLSSFPSTAYCRDCLFSIVYSCLFCQRLSDCSVWVYFWAFYSVPLIHLSVFVPVPYVLITIALQYSQVRQRDSSSSVFLFQDHFGYLGSFVFPYKLNKKNFFFCSSSVKNAIGNLIGIAFNLQIAPSYLLKMVW